MQRRFFNPRKPPYGYAITGQEGIWQVVLGSPEEIEVVRWLFWAFEQQGVTCHRLASDLNTRGIPSPSGTKWRLSEVSTILRNRAYGGMSNGPPLVSIEQFERIQARISRI